jgi:hypothetical protein
MIFLSLVRQVFVWYVKLGHKFQGRGRWWAVVNVLMIL